MTMFSRPFTHLKQYIARLLGLETQDGPVIFRGALGFFLLSVGYGLLRPLREAFITGEVKNIQWLYLGTLGVMLVINPPFAWLVARLPRHLLIPMVFRGISGIMLLFGLGFFLFPVDLGPGRGLRIAFVIALSVFNLFLLSVFWGAMAGMSDAPSSRRRFGPIACGITLGMLTGATLTRWMAKIDSDSFILFLFPLAAIFFELAVHVRPGKRIAAENYSAKNGEKENSVSTHQPFLDGVRLVGGSPYLLGIGGFLLCYTITSSILSYLIHHAVSTEMIGEAATTRFWAWETQWTNGLTLFGQMVIASRLIPRLGTGWTLALLPLVTGGGFLLAGRLARLDDEIINGLSPYLLVLLILLITRKVVNYSLTKPAKESLYAGLGREERYAAKSLLDTFVYRLGDQVGIFAAAGLGWGAMALGWVVAPLALGWGVLGLWLGRKQARR